MSADKETFIPKDNYTIYDHVIKHYDDRTQWSKAFNEWWQDAATTADQKVTQLQRFPAIAPPKTKYLGLFNDKSDFARNNSDDFATMLQPMLSEELLKYARNSPNNINYSRAIANLILYLSGIQREQDGIAVKHPYLALDRHLGAALALSYLYIHDKEANQHEMELFIKSTSGSSSPWLKFLGAILIIAGIVAFGLSVGYAIGFTLAGINLALQTLSITTAVGATIGVSLCALGIFSIYQGRQTCIANHMQNVMDLNTGNPDPLAAL